LTLAEGNPARGANPALRRVGVTGLGVVTACGVGRGPLREALASGRSPVRAMELFDVSTCRSRTAAQVGALDERPDGAMRARDWRRLDRASRMLLVAAHEALSEAGLRGRPLDAPLVVATTGGGMRAAEHFHRTVLGGGADRRSVPWLANYLPHRQTLDVQAHYAVRGPIVIFANACASSANAIGYASQLIQRGEADIAVTGGWDALAELIFAGFDSILAATPTRCRPFDAARDGMVLGEGAAVLVLESFERAKGRGAPVLAEVRGYGQSIDTLHMTQPNPEATGALASMRMACRTGGLSPETIDYVNAHGTATAQNDSMEARAIRRLMPERGAEVFVGSTKPITGHTLGAAGAVEAVIGILALQEQLVPPNLHYEQPDPACDVRVPAAPTPCRLRTVLSNSFGFGGLNASLVLGLP
jgi:3-oxoacyl-[acyl-carrier-protein] synthase II